MIKKIGTTVRTATQSYSSKRYPIRRLASLCTFLRHPSMDYIITNPDATRNIIGPDIKQTSNDVCLYVKGRHL